jgi:hypothetical protein
MDMLRTTKGAPHDRRSRFGTRGSIVADGLGAGWVLMLVFSMGGIAGVVLASLLMMAGAESPASESDGGD